MQGLFRFLNFRGSIYGCQSTSYFHIYFTYDILMLEHLSCGKLTCLCDLVDLVISQTDYYILWFKISMDDLAHTMHVVKAD